MPKILITTVPFAERQRKPIELLEACGADYVVNPLCRKLKEEELAEMVADVDVLIAGTEPITDTVMERANRLKLISRVGVGLDSIDLIAAERRGIRVSYTPDAPAPAVAELAVGLIISLLRCIHVANAQLHRGEWNRYFGRRVSETTFGIIGVGRIGLRVLRFLHGLGASRLLLNDINPEVRLDPDFEPEWVSKDEIYRRADVISIHVPLTARTKNMVTSEQFNRMKRDALLVNTSRGGIVNEKDLADALNAEYLAGAAIDVFEREPYFGPLAAIDNCLLTSHMGSMAIDCRTQMEVEATEEAVRFIKGEPLMALVPCDEYMAQKNVLDQ